MANNGAIEDLTVRNLSYFVGNDGSGRVGRQPTNTLVPTSRQVVGGNGLSGGGPLTSDITLSIDPTQLQAIITSILASLPTAPTATPTWWINGGVLMYS